MDDEESVCLCVFVDGEAAGKMTFLKLSSKKIWLSGAVENKFLRLAVEWNPGTSCLRMPLWAGIKVFYGSYPGFSVHFLLESYPINLGLSLTSKSNQLNLLFTEISLGDLTWTNRLMMIMCSKIRLAQELGSEGGFHALPLAWNVFSMLFCLANSLTCSLRLPWVAGLM